MPLVERLLGLEEPKIPIHAFQAVVSEWAKGKLTAAQAQTALTWNSGAPLDQASIDETLALVNTIPAGTTTAQQAARALRLIEIDQVLLLADTLTPPYDTAASVRARLGL